MDDINKEETNPLLDMIEVMGVIFGNIENNNQELNTVITENIDRVNNVERTKTKENTIFGFDIEPLFLTENINKGQKNEHSNG